MDPNRIFVGHRRRVVPSARHRPASTGRGWLAGIVMVGAATATMLLAQQTVDDWVNGARDDATGLVDTVTSTVGDLTDPVVQPPGGGGGPGAHHCGGSGHHPGGSTNGHRHASGSATGTSVLSREGGTVVQIGSATNGHADASPADATDQRSPGTRLREAAVGIAISLLIVLGALLLFMTIQARLDRRDPKLALAPVIADVVTFT